MTLPTAIAEKMRLGAADGPPIGVVIKVANRDELPAVGVIVDELLGFARVRLAKARLPRAVAARDTATAEIAEAFRAELSGYFTALLGRAGIRKADDLSLDPDDVDWARERRELRKVLARFYLELGEAAYDVVGRQLGLELSFDLEAPAVKPVRDRLATMVTSITERTREVIVSYVETATERGYSIEQLVRGVDGDGFLGLEAIFGERAQTIALTETATAYNLASNASYRDSGLVETVVVFDGPDCGWTDHDDPDSADGSTRSLDEADEYPTAHPNCQRAFGPVVSE